ncbi:MAG TPA: hypothetical protein DD381_12950 [Lentisphaeria bacterium]|nr:MAG: glyoxalase [Lentisphaerae bacterium GWF2_38_69]HBM17230.1 hypothetical protein [Lentisphaeria bacterium]
MHIQELKVKIDHLAIWAEDLEKLKNFYEKYFNARSNNKYRNQNKNFESYFLSFNSGASLEIMNKPEIGSSGKNLYSQYLGITHIAFSLGSRELVDELTCRLKNDGLKILDGPRLTGDGHYETLFLDPEGNRIEITE